MNVARVNYVNIGLMLISCVVAFIIPFELFLFSYAVVGPLHYVTEISGLHNRKYFSPKKNDWILLSILTLIIVFPGIFGYAYMQAGPKGIDGRTIITPAIADLMGFFTDINPAVMFLAFSASLIMILVKDSRYRLVSFALLFLVGWLIRTQDFSIIIFTIFLPTLVHVFLFTGAFILVGALKSNSTSGLLSILVFIGCALSFFFILPDGAGYQISEYAKRSYEVSFRSLNEQIFRSFLHENEPGEATIYYSSTGILITRFIAYAYTYHYLNWFSKTSIIKWHEVARPQLIAIFALWIIAVVLYATNYRTGLMALYFLSFLHVVLEFPLNFQSFRQIGQEVRSRFSRSSPA